MEHTESVAQSSVKPLAAGLLLAMLLHSLLLILPVPAGWNPAINTMNEKQLEIVLEVQVQQQSLHQPAVSSAANANKVNATQPGVAKKSGGVKPITRKNAKALTAVRDRNSQLSIDNLLDSVRQDTIKAIRSQQQYRVTSKPWQNSQLRPTKKLFNASELFKGNLYSKVTSARRDDGNTYVMLIDKKGKRRCFIVKPERAFKTLAENLWYFESC